MAFLTDVELNSLTIEQSVFHIVGPQPQDFQLLAAFDATPHANFFLERIRSVNKGNRYVFLSDAAPQAQLSRIDADAAKFQDESEKLAEAFNNGHRGSAVIGAFLIFSLKCSSGRLFALLKFDDERVLRYDIDTAASGKPQPKLAEIQRTFVQNRHALQKAALVRLSDSSVCVVDRQNPQRPAAYFEQFLGVKRLLGETDLTRKLIEVTQGVVRKHREILPKDVMRTLARRLYDATQSGGSVDGDDIGDWIKSIVGPLPDESPVLADLKAQLERAGISGESFVLDKRAVEAPSNRKVETASGVRITFPSDLQSSIVTVDREKGVITIKDEITVDDVELDISNRTRR